MKYHIIVYVWYKQETNRIENVIHGFYQLLLRWQRFGVQFIMDLYYIETYKNISFEISFIWMKLWMDT